MLAIEISLVDIMVWAVTYCRRLMLVDGIQMSFE
jgi:hypothetical protein